MTSRYSILPIVLKSILNPGDECKIRIIISGYGEIKKNKFFVNYHPTLISPEKLGKIQTCIKTGVKKSTGEKYPAMGKQGLDFRSLSISGAMMIGLAEGYFMTAAKDLPDFAYPQICSEVIWDNYYPIEVNLNISDKCPPGDYDLDFVLTYGNEHNILQDKNRVSIHVTSWLERYRGKLAFIGAVGTIATISYGLITFFL